MNLRVSLLLNTILHKTWGETDSCAEVHLYNSAKDRVGEETETVQNAWFLPSGESGCCTASAEFVRHLQEPATLAEFSSL